MPKATTTRRRGSTAVMAMMFLILFACLALGFFYTVVQSTRIAANEQDVARAQLAADSGLQFLRYHLATLDIPPGTPDAAMAAEVAADLRAKLEGSGNLGNRTLSRAGNVITIPPIANELVNGVPTSTFAGRLEWVPVAAPGTSYLRATVTGHSAGSAGATLARRAVRLDYSVKGKPTKLFNYGIASKGAVTIKASGQTQVLGTPDGAASILSAAGGATSISTGNGPVDGDLAVVVNKSQVALGGGTVGGASNTQLIRDQHVSVVPAPSFPAVDTSAFKQYAVNVYKDKAAYQKNIRVPAGTDPKFTAGDVVEGILYIESPNDVTFRGHCEINGVIVFEGKAGAASSLDFRGNVSPGKIPDTPEFAAIRAAVKGWAILAPTASVTMSGSVDATVEGTIMARQVTFAGSADLHLTRGSVVSLGDAVTDIGGKTLHFHGTGADNPPTTGLTFSGSFKPDPASYYEPQH